MELTEKQIERYSRQIVLKEIGGFGQGKLLNSTVTLIGLGALGSPSAYYLTAAGIGHLKIIDFDVVEPSNLHRQILHFTGDIKRKKTESAVEKLNSLNPDCNVEIIDERVDISNSKRLLADSDFVIEGSDNLTTKMLVNDTCVNLKIPFTIAGVLRFHGQIISVIPDKKTACYRCVFGDMTGGDTGLSCSEAGVVGLIPGVVGCIEANEAIKYILDVGELLTNKVFFVDLLTNRFSFISVYRNENCSACGEHPKPLLELARYEESDRCFE